MRYKVKRIDIPPLSLRSKDCELYRPYPRGVFVRSDDLSSFHKRFKSCNKVIKSFSLSGLIFHQRDTKHYGPVSVGSIIQERTKTRDKPSCNLWSHYPHRPPEITYPRSLNLAIVGLLHEEGWSLDRDRETVTEFPLQRDPGKRTVGRLFLGNINCCNTSVVVIKLSLLLRWTMCQVVVLISTPLTILSRDSSTSGLPL